MAYTYETLHQLIHATPHNPEDTLILQLDSKELLLVCAGLTLIYNLQPCLVEDVDNLSVKLDEIMTVQWSDDEDQ